MPAAHESHHMDGRGFRGWVHGIRHSHNHDTDNLGQEHDTGEHESHDEVSSLRAKLSLTACSVGALTLAGLVELKSGIGIGKDEVLGHLSVGVHNLGDALVDGSRVLSLFASEAKKKTVSRRARRFASIVMGATTVFSLYQTSEQAHDIWESPQDLDEFDAEPLSKTSIISSLGNVGTAFLRAWGTRGTRLHGESVSHALRDGFEAVVHNATTGNALAEVAGGGVVGVWGGGLTRNMWRNSDEEAHGHSHNHGHLGQALQKLRNARKNDRQLNIWAGAKALEVAKRGGGFVRDLFIEQADTGERRIRRGAVAITALGGLALGAYLVSKFGVTSANNQPQVHDHALSDMWGGPDALDPPAFDALPLEPTVPEVPVVRLQPGSNPWNAVGAYAESLGYPKPNLQQHDALKDVVVNLLGRDATQLPPGYEVPMPTPSQVETIYDTW